MWLCTKLGFYSIVKKGEEYHVRARVKKDLVNLCKACGCPPNIKEWPAADYRWRLVMNEDFAGLLFGILFESIDYPNFKSEVAARPDQRAKLPAYHTLWAGLASLQNEGEKNE